MVNNIGNKKEINIYFERYFECITFLNSTYELGNKLSKFLKENEKINDVFSIVFSIILKSLKTEFIISLSKIYDIRIDNIDNNPKGCSRSDYNIINYLFEIEKLGVDISEDIEIIKSKKEIIKYLLIVRDKYYAHFDKEFFNTPELMNEIKPLTYGNLIELIELSTNLINKYSGLLNENEYYCKFIRLNDDLDYFLKILKDYFENEEKRRREILNRYKES